MAWPCPSPQPASLLGVGGVAHWPSLGPPQSLPSPSPSLSLLPGKTSLWSPRSEGQMPNGPRRFPGAGQGGEASQLGSSLSKWCVWPGLSAHPPGAPSPPTGSSWGAIKTRWRLPLGQPRAAGTETESCQVLGRPDGAHTPKRGPEEGQGLLDCTDPNPSTTVGAPRPRGAEPPPPQAPPPQAGLVPAPCPSSSPPSAGSGPKHPPTPSWTLLPSIGAFSAGTPPTKHPGAPEPRAGPMAWG